MQYISQYDESGYLPEAMFNFMALLGWSPEGEEEIFSKEELIAQFSEHRLSKAPSVFDVNKLKWVNAQYIHKMDSDAFYAHALPYLKAAIENPDIDLKALCAIIQPRIETFGEIKDAVDFFNALPSYDNALYTHKKMKTN